MKKIIFVIFFVMRLLKYIILINFLHFTGAVSAQMLAPKKYEYRAVWLTTIENLDWPRTKISVPADVGRQKLELVLLLDSLKSLNVNTILLQTRLRGDVIYPSKYEPFSAVLTGTPGKSPGYDPLAFAIDECHKRGMQLHAWLVTLPLGKMAHVKRLGRHSLRYKHPQLCRAYQGQWYMEPAEPGTAEYLKKLVNEIVSNYDVDGIHLDYIRYPDRPKNYPDHALYRRMAKGRSHADWRRDNITHIVREIYNGVKQLKPWVRVSCAPLGKHADLSAYSSLGWNAYNTVFQEAQRWLDEGIMDILFPMLYFKGNDFYPFVRDWQENSSGRHIVPGIGVYRLLSGEGDWPLVEIERQLNTSRSAGTAGTAMFRTKHLLQDIKGVAGCYSCIYSNAAMVPPMPWASKGLLAAPANIRYEQCGDTLRLSWSAVKAHEGMPPVRYNIYASLQYPVDLSDTGNLVATALSDTSFVALRSPVATTYWVVVPVDAYGVEGWVAECKVEGCNPKLYRDEFNLPESSTWGMRVHIRSTSGVLLYDVPYNRCVGVRGLPRGAYMLEVALRDGTVVKRVPFTR